MQDSRKMILMLSPRVAHISQKEINLELMQQHAVDFPSNSNLVYSVMTNRIRNNPISKREINICNDMLGRSKYVSQGKTTMASSDPICTNTQIVELPHTTLDHY